MNQVFYEFLERIDPMTSYGFRIWFNRMDYLKKNENDDSRRLFDIISDKVFTKEFISGIAGDRFQTNEEKELFEALLSESEGDFYVKVLFHLTYEVFEKNRAFSIWNEILRHKKELSRLLNRNVEITVATLDYLTNIKKEILAPKIIGESFLGKIVELSSVDTLTKLYNRQHLMQVLNIEIRRYIRYKTPFSLLMIDIDHFKSINDNFGHNIGDKVLMEVSRILLLNLRELDICTRFGGEEFIIVLPHTEEEEALDLAERIRVNVKEAFSSEYNLTISIGISIVSDRCDIFELIKEADRALYRSKENGRDKTTVYSRI